MPTTSNRAYRYPSSTDDVRPYEDIQFLATDVDTDMNTIIRPGWTNYTPTWTGSGSNPAIGNGTLSGRSRRVASVTDIVIAEIYMRAGSTTTYGTGFWTFSLPFVAHADSILSSIGGAYFYDVGTLTRTGACRLMIDPSTPGGAGDKLLLDHPTLGVISSTVPHTWANTDILTAQITYRPA